MSILDKPISNGYSGFKTLKYAYIEDITALQLNRSDLVAPESGILFRATKEWNNIYFTPGTLVVEEKEKESEAGKQVEFEIRGNYPGINRGISAELELMRHHLFLLRLEDMNGNKFLYGSLETPFTFSYEPKKGNTPAGTKHYEFSFNGNMLNSAYYIE